jgi:hypothetical protein
LSKQPLAHHRGDRVEDLREVAATLALDQHGDDEVAEVAHRHTHGEVRHGLVERHAVVDLFERGAELGTQRRLDFLADHAERPGERVASTQRAADHVDGVWQLHFFA